ncbi:putative reverse transcriptase domain-containing protein [Tanacetum coccineum]
MPPRRSPATARAAAATATPMTAAAIKQLIEARVSTALANHDTLRNSINGHGNGSLNSGTRTRGSTRTPHWKALKKMMIVKYYPRGEIKKFEIELWNLKVKGTDVASYTLRFQELALMCGRMFHEESEEVEKYVGGLPDMIRGNVMSYQPKTMEKAIEFANDQMDQKVLTITERQAEQKRKLEFNAGNNQGHQQQNKRQNTGRAYTAGPGEKREYTGSLPLCTKCNYHHKGPCAPRCNKCKKIGHLARDCRSSGPNGNNNNRGNFGTTQNAVTCYECGVQGHFKKDCPKLKNGNRGNQRGNGNAPAKVYVVGNAGTNPDSNVVTGTFLLNDRYASILFDTGADRSFLLDYNRFKKLYYNNGIYTGTFICAYIHALHYFLILPLPITLFTLRAQIWKYSNLRILTKGRKQLLEQAPRSPEYVPENHIPVYIPEPEHPEDLVPAEDEAPIPPLPPSFLAPRIRPLSPRALEVEMRDIASAYYHSLHPSGTPPLLPIPLPAPSTSRRADIPEADTPPRKRLLLTTPRPGCEIGESSAAAARQPGPTIETRLLDTERRIMTALELVNRRITYQVDVCTRESSEFCTRHHDAQTDRAAVRAEIEVLRRERLAYEQEGMETRQALARSEAHCRTLEARVTVLETDARRHEWQRQAADDLAVQYIMRTQALEAGARVDTLEDTGSSS